MRPNRFTLLLAAILALGVVACEPPRNPTRGTVTPAPRTDEEGVLLLDGLGDLGPRIQAAMGTREERAARAPYSPPGWPLKRGDIVSDLQRMKLDDQFPRLCEMDVPHVFWVGDMAFGAIWSSKTPAFRASIGTGKPPGLDVPSYRYVGHVHMYAGCELDELPPHVRDPSKVLHWLTGTDGRGRYRKPTGADYSQDRPEEIWTEERWLAGYVGEGDDR